MISCKKCDDKQFIYSESAQEIRRCMTCNAPQVEFTILFIPDPEGDAFTVEDDFIDCLAEKFNEVAAILDREEITENF